MSCHETIVDTMAYENFRAGLQLGVMLIVEAVKDRSLGRGDFDLFFMYLQSFILPVLQPILQSLSSTP